MLHSGIGAIVGKFGDDAEARTAVGAIGEGVEIASVGWVKNLLQAVATGGNVRENYSSFISGGITGKNLEFSVLSWV